MRFNSQFINIAVWFAIVSCVAIGADAASRKQPSPDQSGSQNVIGALPPTPAVVSSCLVPGCDATAFIVAAIDTAGPGDEVLGQAYNFTDNAIRDAVIRAKERKANVRGVLIDKVTACQRNSAVDWLMAANIPISVDKKPKIQHNKVWIIAQKKVIEGSFNFSGNARHNAENTNLIESEVVANWYRSQWERRLAASVPYTKKEDFCKNHDKGETD